MMIGEHDLFRHRLVEKEFREVCSLQRVHLYNSVDDGPDCTKPYGASTMRAGKQTYDLTHNST